MKTSDLSGISYAKLGFVLIYQKKTHSEQQAKGIARQAYKVFSRPYLIKKGKTSHIFPHFTLLFLFMTSVGDVKPDLDMEV